ncbi:Zn(2)-C6 fungal-type domain-containing protein [Mycena venus]|uniref:Zn(2)-C6 fungal-type domain-containing protein n=1 Tax=Mycena venus TaxID=2733690 RepID=A0A8H6XYT6_9AGAR|nr:Zn(2)-C6 fungal-type domain-containing protein [Mycena venus]
MLSSSSEFQTDASHDLDLENPRHDPLEMPPSLFPPSPPGRGRALDAPMPRLPSHTRAFSHSSQPTFPGVHHHNTSLVSRHSHSDLEYLHNPCFDDDTADRYLPHSTTAVEEFLDESFMAAHILDFPTQCSTYKDSYHLSYPHSDSSVSSPEATGTTSSSSPPAEIFSTHSSPGYLMKDLPDGMETARPQSGFGRHPLSPHYFKPYGHNNYTETTYQDSLALPRPASFHESPMHQRTVNNWGYLPPTLPSISQNSRYTMPRLPSPPNSHHVNTFGQFPVAEDLRRWPQMFKINHVKKNGAKKQMMACLFCRERKIGCSRPPEDDPDQTCNQCARRKRKCEYPTESRRGQHTRNRLSSKKFLGLEDPKVLAVTPPKLPVTE